MIQYTCLILIFCFPHVAHAIGWESDFLGPSSSQKNATKQRVFYPPAYAVNNFLEDLKKPFHEKINRDLQPSFEWKGIQWMIDIKAKNLHPLWTTTPVEENFRIVHVQESPFLSCFYDQQDERGRIYTIPLIPAGDLMNLEAVVNVKSNSSDFAYFFSYQEIDPLAYVAESVIMDSVT